MRKINILLFLCICISPIFAQQGWTLEMCINYAIEHNLDLQKMDLQKQTSELTLHTSKMSRLPDLNAGLGQSFGFGRSKNRDGVLADRNSASTSLNASLSAPIFTGLRITNEVAANKLALKAITEELNQAKQDLGIRVTNLFLQVLFNKELVNISEQQLALSKDQLTKTEQLVTYGKTPESELYEAKSVFATNEQSLVEARNAYMLSQLDLAQALEIDDTNSFIVQDPLLEESILQGEILLTEKNQIYETALAHRASVKAAKYRIEESKKNVNISKSGYMPTLSFGANYSNGYYHNYGKENAQFNTSFSEQLKANNSYGLGVNLNIPIFNRFATRNRVKSAKIGVVMQEINLIQAQKNLRKEVEQAYYNAVASNEKFKAAQNSLDAAKIAYQYMQARYDAGKATAFEFGELKARIGKSEAQLAQAKFEFILRCKILDFYMGKPISL
ncbi:MAG: TolC family protein [Bacteroidales bacterium]